MFGTSSFQASRFTVGRSVFAAALLGVVLCVTNHGCGDESDSGEEVVQDLIRARGFVVVDESGEARAELGVTESGQTRLAVCGPNGKRMLWAGVYESGLPGVALLNSDEEPMVELGLLNDAEPFVLLRDEQGTHRIGARVTSDGSIGVMLYDSEGALRARLALDKEGLPRLVLLDRTGVRAVMRVYEIGQCALDLLDSKQNMRVGLFSESKDTAGVAVFNAEAELIGTIPEGDVEGHEKRRP